MFDKKKSSILRIIFCLVLLNSDARAALFLPPFYMFKDGQTPTDIAKKQGYHQLATRILVSSKGLLTEPVIQLQ